MDRKPTDALWLRGFLGVLREDLAKQGYARAAEKLREAIAELPAPAQAPRDEAGSNVVAFPRR